MLETTFLANLKTGKILNFKNFSVDNFAISIGLAALVIFCANQPLFVTSEPLQPSKISGMPDEAAQKIQRPWGLDVSHYQVGIDWKTLKKSGPRFVFAKATEGTTYVDRQFESNRNAAKSVGLLFGAYHFYRPKDDPIMQAKHFLNHTKLGAHDLVPVLDLEIAPPTMNKETYLRDVKKWINYVKAQSGCTPMIYADPAFSNAYLGTSLDVPFYWMAEYSKNPHPPSGKSDWSLWQHTQTGHVAGFKGFVDLNWARSENALNSLSCAKGTK